MTHRHRLACIVPPRLLQQLTESATEATRRAAIETLVLDDVLRRRRDQNVAELGGRRAPPAPAAVTARPDRVIHDLGHDTEGDGVIVRVEGGDPTGDAATDEAYDGLGATWSLYWDRFERDSIDGAGMTLHAVVHYGNQYDNAFWDGERMIFGDGDGISFTGFTSSVDVIGHELTHGVTQYEANLTYSGQSGALNESISDVFGSLVRQRVLGQDAASADWLIGADCVGPELAPALRSMKDPGHANRYDDQPADMDGYVETTDDNGGVHTNSGIPNRAFYLVASAIGGNAWEAPGLIWYASLRDPDLAPDADFSTWAATTTRHAAMLYGDQSTEADAVRRAWEGVKVS